MSTGSRQSSHACSETKKNCRPPQIFQALARSKFLIVICSRDTPESRWVGEEIRRFVAIGRADRILALLIDGSASESFPPGLRRVEDPERPGRLIEREPLAADVRPRSGDSPRRQRRMAKLRILACVLGCSFDQLRQRHRERLIRRRRFAVGIMFACIALVVVAAFEYTRTSQSLSATLEELQSTQTDLRSTSESLRQTEGDLAIAAEQREFAEDIADQEQTHRLISDGNRLIRLGEYEAARAMLSKARAQSIGLASSTLVADILLASVGALSPTPLARYDTSWQTLRVSTQSSQGTLGRVPLFPAISGDGNRVATLHIPLHSDEAFIRVVQPFTHEYLYTLSVIGRPLFRWMNGRELLFVLGETEIWSFDAATGKKVHGPITVEASQRPPAVQGDNGLYPAAGMMARRWSIGFFSDPAPDIGIAGEQFRVGRILYDLERNTHRALPLSGSALIAPDTSYAIDLDPEGGPPLALDPLTADVVHVIRGVRAASASQLSMNFLLTVNGYFATRSARELAIHRIDRGSPSPASIGSVQMPWISPFRPGGSLSSDRHPVIAFSHLGDQHGVMTPNSRKPPGGFHGHWHFVIDLEDATAMVSTFDETTHAPFAIMEERVHDRTAGAPDARMYLLCTHGLSQLAFWRRTRTALTSDPRQMFDRPTGEAPNDRTIVMDSGIRVASTHVDFEVYSPEDDTKPISSMSRKGQWLEGATAGAAQLLTYQRTDYEWPGPSEPRLRLRDAATGEVLAEFVVPRVDREDYRRAAISPDGSLVALADPSVGLLRFYDAETGTAITELEIETMTGLTTDGVPRPYFSTDGTRFAYRDLILDLLAPIKTTDAILGRRKAIEAHALAPGEDKELAAALANWYELNQRPDLAAQILRLAARDGSNEDESLRLLITVLAVEGQLHRESRDWRDYIRITFDYESIGVSDSVSAHRLDKAMQRFQASGY